MEQGYRVLDTNYPVVGRWMKPTVRDRETAPALMIQVLGTPVLRLGNAPLAFARRKALALLVYLATTHRVHTREALATLLWGDLPQERAFANLRKILSELREQIDNALIITRDTIALDPDYPVSLDIATFEAAVDRGIGDADPRMLAVAVADYRDDFLAGWSLPDAEDFDDWLLLQREHLRSRFAEALQALAQKHAAVHQFPAAIAATRRLLALEPWREEAHRALMVLLARNGERRAAVAQFGVCRRVLAEELGVDPMEETQALYRRLLAGDADVNQDRAMPQGGWRHAVRVAAHNAPSRAALLAETDRLLARIEALTPSELRMLAANLTQIADDTDHPRDM
jgi:DNA-binding SARP family transcriptional activator